MKGSNKELGDGILGQRVKVVRCMKCDGERVESVRCVCSLKEQVVRISPNDACYLGTETFPVEGTRLRVHPREIELVPHEERGSFLTRLFRARFFQRQEVSAAGD